MESVSSRACTNEGQHYLYCCDGSRPTGTGSYELAFFVRHMIGLRLLSSQGSLMWDALLYI